eukprot:7937402-Pyramimonas_sp.AAC.1
MTGRRTPSSGTHGHRQRHQRLAVLHHRVPQPGASRIHVERPQAQAGGVWRRRQRDRQLDGTRGLVPLR